MITKKLSEEHDLVHLDWSTVDYEVPYFCDIEIDEKE
jgi:hypothetical protein